MILEVKINWGPSHSGELNCKAEYTNIQAKARENFPNSENS